MPQTTKDTPMMQQYLSIKKDYPDAFLFYRIGDFYEMFYDDAVKGAQILELTLTARNKNASDPIPMCGVPHHAADSYIEILVEKGYKVAICEQLEDPKDAKGMVKRGIIKLVTPGTNLDAKPDQSKENNYLAAVYLKQEQYYLAYTDFSTGEVKVTTLANLAQVQDELLNLRAKEVVVPADTSEQIITKLQQLGIMISKQELTQDHAEVAFVNQNLADTQQKKVVTYLISYLVETQKRSLTHLQLAQSYELNKYLQMDHNAQSNLELFRSLRTGDKSGTLTWLLDETKTAMGGRLLKQWLQRPLMDATELKARQATVQLLLDNFFQRGSLQDYLTKVYDLERLAGRIAFGSVNGRDLIQLMTSLQQVPNIKAILRDIQAPILDNLVATMPDCSTLESLIGKAIVTDPPISVTEGNIICDGYNELLDKYRSAMQNGKAWIAQLQAKEQEVTGIKNLKIGFNRVFGYYIEVTNANKSQVPTDRYERKQTLTNAERYITPELKEKEQLILEAEEKSVTLEYELFKEVRDKIKQHLADLQVLAQILARLDVLQGFAVVSETYHYVCPEFTKQNNIQIDAGRHPVVEKVLGKQDYIANDIKMDPKTAVLLITGPNMSGKSTYMRQMALTVIMAQVGCFVPAQKAVLPIFDHIFTRIGAADDLIAGNSTFMVEMMEANDALQHATNKSLIIFDEIGRGTATYDGMALAQAIIEYLNKHIQAKTMFSTHYHELTQLADELTTVKNVHVDATQENGQLVFLHKVLPGPADKSYGIHVAKLAGLPDTLLQRAQAILTDLEAKDTNLQSKTAVTISEPVDDQLSLFNTVSDMQQQLLDDLKTVNLMKMTPLAALNYLAELQSKLETES
ncbi:DNA mismatch repair protein MutS [Bombilactobacillus thymidiniphilus]|uniref:DNA mismatch repair protein MutS n=1 Tax=Bombilactobacillus thymidiniphilus TaxID=2923363 RepID=A0ABY4PE03_9LACO|nr:DNA mismatch repair protein MutS [Bombilactobacillus thymidiniphilus]UQS83909.1 DNA mismatch repair protein MutS [Bombilactobacillus thymidiniphilus]